MQTRWVDDDAALQMRMRPTEGGNMATRPRKYEMSSTIGWADHGVCKTCGQKTTSSPKTCKSEEHRAFYRSRQERINARRRGG
jgi:hypothetical protein